MMDIEDIGWLVIIVVGLIFISAFIVGVFDSFVMIGDSK